MLQNCPIHRLVTAACTIALAFAPAFLHADSLGFSQTNLVSDIPNLAANTDPNLKNPWGVAFSATSPFWTSDQRTGLSTLYNAAGAPQCLVVTVPGSATPPTGPTGMVFSNIAGQFLLTNGNASDLHLRQSERIDLRMEWRQQARQDSDGLNPRRYLHRPRTGSRLAARTSSMRRIQPAVSTYSTPDGPTSPIRHLPASSSTPNPP